MPPAVSTRENALANLVTTLEAVEAGANYNYTIEKVGRIDGPFFIYLDQTYRTLAFVEEGNSSWALDRHDGTWLVTVEVFVQVARVYEDEDVPPWDATETKSTIRSKMIGDVVKALLASNTRGGYAKRGFIVTDDAPLYAPEEYDPEGRWVAHEIRFEMAIEVDESTP